MRIVALAAFLWAASSFAAWEAAVIFLGAQEESATYQKDIDRNILELARTTPGENFRLSVYREFPTRAVAYHANASSKGAVWDTLFEAPPMKGVRIPGSLREEKVKSHLFYDDDRLERFLKKAFTLEGSKRLLVIYSHGLAFDGLRGVRLKDVRSQLEAFLPRREKNTPLDLLWLNSCFMSTIEVAYELRGLTQYLLASEDEEFTAGAPFESLRTLSDGEVEKVASELAEAYLTSYSIARKGSQSSQVFLSSATISLIETARLPLLVDGLQWIVTALKPLTKEEKETLRRSRKRIAIQMEKLRLMIDLGSFLGYVHERKDRFKSEEAQARLDSVLHLLELSNEAKLKTNPRLPLVPPRTGLRLVYGYENWTKGDFDDEDTLARIPKELKFDDFLPGPKNKKWPSRPMPSRLFLSPFAPGLNSFHYFFAEPTAPFIRVGESHDYVRTGDDIAIFQASHRGNPIRFSGYTQRAGKAAEKYTGLSVLDPTEEEVPPSYSFTDFSRKTLWEELLGN